jgi:hypothetical protein
LPRRRAAGLNKMPSAWPIPSGPSIPCRASASPMNARFVLFVSFCNKI